MRTLILVCYYIKSEYEIVNLINKFESEIDFFHSNLIIIDNNNVIDQNFNFKMRDIRLIYGSNSSWEFSGWIEGLESDLTSSKTITLLNDSYLRNWNITIASRFLLKKMYRHADSGMIACWFDIFSWIKPPIFSRRPNSRMVVLPYNKKDYFIESLKMAIDRYFYAIENYSSLFSKNDGRRLDEWISTQCAINRWDNSSINTRLGRIFIEHHAFDNIHRTNLIKIPKTFLGSVLYSFLRRLFRERR
jgi:hypothetical protein